MLPRERQLAAINRTPADRVSIDCICVENVEKLAEYIGIPQGEINDYLGIDGRVVAPWRYIGATEGKTGIWDTTAELDYSADTGHIYPFAGAECVRDIEMFKFPDGRAFDFITPANEARILHETYAVRGPYWVPIFSRLNSLFGMEETMVKMLLKPAVFEAALEHVFEFTYELTDEFLRTAGDSIDILCLADDFATQRGMLFSPELWRRYFKKGFRRLFELGKKRGKKVWFHSCGNILDVLPDLIEIGADVWETVQLHTLPIDAAALKREYGRQIVFFGGINTQRLPFMKPDEVRDEARRVIGALGGSGGGYIFGPDHHIKPDVPFENVKVLFETAKEFRL